MSNKRQKTCIRLPDNRISRAYEKGKGREAGEVARSFPGRQVPRVPKFQKLQNLGIRQEFSFSPLRLWPIFASPLFASIPPAIRHAAYETLHPLPTWTSLELKMGFTEKWHVQLCVHWVPT